MQRCAGYSGALHNVQRHNMKHTPRKLKLIVTETAVLRAHCLYSGITPGDIKDIQCAVSRLAVCKASFKIGETTLSF